MCSGPFPVISYGPQHSPGATDSCKHIPYTTWLYWQHSWLQVLAHGGTGHARHLLRGGEGGGRAEGGGREEGGGDAGVRVEAARDDPSAGASASDAALRATPGTLSDPGAVPGATDGRADDRAAREALGPLLYQDLGVRALPCISVMGKRLLISFERSRPCPFMHLVRGC